MTTRLTRAQAAPVLLLLLLLLPVLVAACSGGDEEGGAAGGTPSSSTATTSTSTSDGGSMTTLPPETERTGTTVAGAADWDGATYDVGVVDRIDRTEDGRTLVIFDRAQVYVGDQVRSGVQLRAEPIVHANTGVELINDNPRLRTFVFHEAGEILRLTNADALCDVEDDETEVEPAWERVSVDDAVSRELWAERLRFSTGC